MSNQYEVTAAAIRQAEKALETLNDFIEVQYEAKGSTMLEQIINYIKNKLSNADYICGRCKYRNIELSHIQGGFTFYIYDCGAISNGIPVFSIRNNGGITEYRVLSEWMMLTLVREWEGFKEELDNSIKKAMSSCTKSINDKLAHIGYVNEQLSKWHI